MTTSLISVVAVIISILPSKATPSLGLETNIFSAQESAGSFPLVQNQQAAPLYAASSDWWGVLHAAGDLRDDVNRVTGVTPVLTTNGSPAGKFAVLIGTLGKSPIIDGLVKSGKLNPDAISGKWESFIIMTISKPLPGIDRALVIAGSDKRGTIYGIYEISEQIGVSPWYWWADVPPQHHKELFIKPGTYVQGPPSVKYRGIFINDEAPDLTGWVREKYGSVPGHSWAANYGRGFYTNLFEVMLRLRANYLWPAMWSNAFNEDDTNNPVLADEYGIVMGASHQEPMMRSQQEWDRRYARTIGSWNYAKHPDVVSNFWREGIERNKNYENLVTIGLRGANDTPMAPGGPGTNMKLLEKIVSDQRSILADVVNPDLTKVPQVWCLYKEVMDYDDAGMRVPDDVTLLWADDNWGNVRRLPTAKERKRSGGAGIYYHLDYVGAPRCYKWINTDPISKIWDQMSLAKQYGADRVWIVNVGHFKGYELPLQFFMSLAWDSDRLKNDNLDEYTRLWAEQQFGPEHASEIADILNQYTKFNGRRKPELLTPDTYSLVNYNEFENVVADYDAIAAKAQAISDELPEAERAAFYELVLFPTKASAQLNKMYLAAAKDELYASQGRASSNDYAEKTRSLFAAETNLMSYFNHDFLNGKWNHFMDQPFIGYTSWAEPRRNSLRAVRLREIQVPDTATMGVAVENSTATVTNGDISLPQFDSLNQQKYFVDVFNKGKSNFDFTATASAPWIVLRDTSGSIEKDKRLWVSVDWSKTPTGTACGTVKLTGAGGEVVVNVNAFHPTEPTRDSLRGFAEGDGYVSIEAAHYTKKTDAGSNRWVEIQNYGRTDSGMRAEGPAEVLATPGKDSPSLEYRMYLFSTGKIDVESIVGPTLSFMPGRPIRYAIAFDDEAPQEITIVPKIFEGFYTNPKWSESVKDSCHKVESMLTIKAPGYHTLKIWMVDPGVVLEKIVVNAGGVKPSYLGPPESFHR